MVNLLSLFLLIPLFLMSGEFTATVNTNQVKVNESFILNLTLKEASANGSPAIDAIKQSFVIHSQQQSSNTVIMNGRISSSTTWKFAIKAPAEGNLTIPAISVNTSVGTLSSNPINIKVSKGDPAGSDSLAIDGVSLATHFSKEKPYKNEPVFLTVKLTSKHSMANLRVNKFAVDDAVVEAHGEPKVFKKVVDGVIANAVEFKYMITPLKGGAIKIPSIVVEGGIPARTKLDMGSLFDNDLEPFLMFPGFEQLKPFTLKTKEETLIVQPSVAGLNPWLPAKSLKIEEIWDDSQTLQVGEPIIRGFKLAAEGVMSHQLPSLYDLQVADDRFKIYLDKPETGDDISGENIRSIRKEQYTIIPQKAGTLSLPEISLTWWDVTKNEKASAVIPAKVLQIAAGPQSVSPIAAAEEQQAPAPILVERATQTSFWLYGLMGGLGMLLTGAVFWVIALRRKIARLTEKPIALPLPRPQAKPLPKESKEKLPDLNPT